LLNQIDGSGEQKNPANVWRKLVAWPVVWAMWWTAWVISWVVIKWTGDIMYMHWLALACIPVQDWAGLKKPWRSS
jgi:hypothetical protein